MMITMKKIKMTMMMIKNFLFCLGYDTRIHKVIDAHVMGRCMMMRYCVWRRVRRVRCSGVRRSHRH